jgi:hypothetical protein
MAAGSTYTPIATTTLGSSAASYTFSSISGSYTDLVVIVNATTTSAAQDLKLQFNSDTSTNYSNTRLLGTGTSAGSNRNTSSVSIYPGYTNTTISTVIINIQNYSNTTTYKTAISRSSLADFEVDAIVGLWRNTAAITSVTIGSTGNFATGSTFTLYGIAAA